ncbi:MAG: peroxiredoxin family protein [Verrucomicrobiota bacterium]|nr:peroxiredoxin family protein [Verrucomicrobiota bacterium]
MKHFVPMIFGKTFQSFQKQACLVFAFATSIQLIAAKQAESEEKSLPEGHSFHGEAFNEGPRQKAYLMKGMGRVRFPITTNKQEAQLFFTQGVSQLHGFWHFEAERSFRQAAMLDPNCAMAYWGMAVANRNNVERAKKFINSAKEHRKNASKREKLWIDSEVNYWADTKKNEKDRRRKMVRDLETIIFDFPDDIEAKAFLAVWLWQSSHKGLPISSHMTINMLIQDVLDIEPMHPCHHFRIHLWDSEKPERALASAANCGQSSPGIAHMWHMPGHIYSKLKRYQDAVWQQEASARVDHAHMIKDRVLPDQIHNFAHNNEWLIRNLNHLGRVNDAVALAKNMIELPRHPNFNTLAKPDVPTEYGKRGSSRYGRSRLIETLLRYEMWEEIINLSQTVYLPYTTIPEEQAKRLAAIGAAHYSLGQEEKGTETLEDLDKIFSQLKQLKLDAGTDAEEKARAEKKNDNDTNKAMVDAMNKFNNRFKTVNQYKAELLVYQSISNKDEETFNKQIGKASRISRERKSQLQLKIGNKKEAQKLASQSAKSTNEVYPLANYVDILWKSEKEKEAIEQFKLLRKISSSIDLEHAVFQRLNPIVKKLNLPEDWRIQNKISHDVGERPSLDSLGPFRWTPSPAAQWSLTDGQGKNHSLNDYTGRPLIVVFYLGKGCAHCIEQLSAFAPEVDSFKQAGIDLIAISTDNVGGLRETFQLNKDKPFPFPLLSDTSLKVFKQYRVFDDFENQPLHGTFLIDRGGLVRWQDISYEPFTKINFLLKESKRLLSQEPPQVTRR